MFHKINSNLNGYLRNMHKKKPFSSFFIFLLHFTLFNTTDTTVSGKNVSHFWKNNSNYFTLQITDKFKYFGMCFKGNVR